MKSNSSSLAFTVLAACAVFASALPAVNAQTLQKAPVNPEFLQYQQEHASKAAVTATGNRFGYVPTPVDLSYLRGRTPASLHTFQALPSSYDLRTLGRLTPIKNQYPWGTCWAFATYSSLESTLLTGETNDFSANNLANTNGFDLGYNGGGQHLMSTAYLTRWSGPINEVDDPYTNGPGHSPLNLTVRKHVQEVLFLSLKANALDNTTIKQAVVNYGAMYVSMYYADAAYNSNNATYYYTNSILTNGEGHAVAIVGWNDDYSAGNFTPTAPGNGAFIVRNSWGTNWGDAGYFYCSYYDTKMGYRGNASFNNAESTTNYSAVYQYDPLGWVNSYGYSSTDAWGANIFTATNTGILRAVGFYTTDIDVRYEIYVYHNITAGSPRSGTLDLTQTGTIPYSGYHTITLNNALSITSGQLFSVVIRFINSSNTFPLAIEYALAEYSSRATSSPGQSYVSSDGTAWTDLTTAYPTANVCIKAFCSTDSNIPDASTVGDIDGDRKADLASTVGSSWYVWFSTAQYLTRGGPYDLGIAGTPLTGDIDGDRLADLIVVVDSNWYVWFSTAQYLVRGGPYDLGLSGTPVTGDIDGDRLADLIVVVGSDWYVWFSTAQYLVRGGPYDLGISGIPAAGDIDGDRLADLIMLVDTNWYVWFSTAQYLVRGGPYALGISGAPQAGDIDGDGLADLIVTDGSDWYVWFSTAQYLVRGGPYTMNVP